MEAGLRRLCDVIMKIGPTRYPKEEFHRAITMTVLLAKLSRRRQQKRVKVLAGICVIIFFYNLLTGHLVLLLLF